MEEQRELNKMCTDCEKLGAGCAGEYNPIFTGCVYKDFIYDDSKKEFKGVMRHEDDKQ